jgi:hypothetical protein
MKRGGLAEWVHLGGRPAQVGALAVLLFAPGCFLVTSGLTSGSIPDPLDAEVAPSARDVALRDVVVPGADGGAMSPTEGGLDGAVQDSDTPDALLNDEGAPDSGAIRLVFVSRAQLLGDFGGLAGADRVCTSELGKPAVAYLQAQGVPADSRIPIGMGIEYRLPSGPVVFPPGAPLATGLVRPINELVGPVVGETVSGLIWTGVRGQNCENWTQQKNANGTVGSTALVGGWTNVKNVNCDELARLVCFQR